MKQGSPLSATALLLTGTLALVACGGTGAPAASAEHGVVVTMPDDPPQPNPVPAGVENQRAASIARAAALELPTAYEAPPGNSLHHVTAAFANMLCAAVFLTGLDYRDAAATIGGFTSPFERRREVVDTIVDFQRQRVSLRLPDGTVRTAARYGSQGCVALPIGEDSVRFTPTVVEPRLPPAETTPWPMGDRLAGDSWPAGLDRARIQAALDAGFGPPEAMTLGLVVTYGGRIIGERYAEGIDERTPLESWSMTKSLTGALIGVLIQQGAYDLWQPAPIPEWQQPGDPRAAIRIGDILRMSSGIRIRAPQDPDFDAAPGYPDHLYLYTGTTDSYRWGATRPPQWAPNTVGRYRNTDPVLASYLVRLAVERRGENYHAFPQRALFDRIGIRNAVIMTDPYGNFLGQGMAFMSARDWARLGNLYLQDGVWNGERILPEGFVSYSATPAPAWVADGRPVYGGGFLWVNGDGGWPLPESAYGFRGAGGQSTTVVPTHGLVVVRLGKYIAAGPGQQALDRMLEMLMEAVPPLER
jgi:CubicO group peptidase (beta-lactamase class C family)